MTKKLIVITIYLIALSKGVFSIKTRFPKDLESLMQSRKEVSMKSEKEPIADIKKLSDEVSLTGELQMGVNNSMEWPTETHEDFKKIKRETIIKANNNRLQNLINLPVRLNVLANVLSQVNQGIIEPRDKPLTRNTIIGNGNTVSSLLNIPLNVDASVNVLSSKSGKGLLGNLLPDDLLNGLLGDGLLDSVLGEDGALGGLLKGDVLNNIVGGILGNTLGDLLSGLLSHDGAKNNSKVNGPELVTKLMNSVLDAVEQIVDNLLHLLLNLLEGLSNGLSNTNLPHLEDPINCSPGASTSKGFHNSGNNNRVSSLINAPVRLNALINALRRLKHEIAKSTNPCGTPVLAGHTIIEGNNNKVSSLINLPIKADAEVNILSKVTQTLLGKPKTTKPVAEHSVIGNVIAGVPLVGQLLGGSPPPNIIAQPVTAGSESPKIQDNNNVISSLLNVVPDVNINLNLLSQVTELLSKSKSSPSGSIPESDPNEICFNVPLENHDTTIVGNNNKESTLVNVKPKINLDLNLLSKINEGSLPGNMPTQRVCIKRPTALPPLHTPTPSHTPTPTHLPTSSTTATTEICFNVWVDESGTIISGNNNNISHLVNVEPNINLGLNLLSSVKKTALHTNLTFKRICVPISSTSKPTFTPATPTNKPVTHSTATSTSTPMPSPTHSQTPTPTQHSNSTPMPSVTPPNSHPPTSSHTPKPTTSTTKQPPTEICFDVWVDESGTIISGNNNHISHLVNVEPNINLGLNLLSRVEKTTLHTNLTHKRICVPISSTPIYTTTSTHPHPTPSPTPKPSPSPAPTATPSPTPSPTPKPSPSPAPTATPSPTPTTTPSHTPTPTAIPTPTPTLTPTPTPTYTPTPTPTPSPTSSHTPANTPYPTLTPTPSVTSKPTTPTNQYPPTEICFDVWVDESGTVVSCNNNDISQLVNVQPKINLNLNLLSQVEQKVPQKNLIHKRICVSISPTSKPTIIPATYTNKPITHPTPSPTSSPTPTPIAHQPTHTPTPPTPTAMPSTEIYSTPSPTPKPTVSTPVTSMNPVTLVTPTSKPVTDPPTQSDKRCFRRICTKWKQCFDYNCISKPKGDIIDT